MNETRQPQIEDSLMQLSGRIETLADQVASLSERLDPVLRPPEPVSTGHKTDEEESRAPLANRLDNFSDRIISITNTVNMLNERLEL